jgi:Sap, sulfolipid-1-addressing protein
MGSAVLVLSVLVALDPVRIGIVALLISRPKPMFSLLSFWLGGMVAGMSVALVVLLFLRDFTLPLMREVISVVSSPIVAQMQVAIGVLAVSSAVLVWVRSWSRQREPLPATGGDASVLMLEPNRSTGSGRLSIRGRLEGGSPAVAFVAGLALATPPVEYLAAMIAILATGATAAEQVGAALMFTLIAFTVAEVPLVSYLAAPTKTLAVLHRLNGWISARRQAIPLAVVGACGLLLVATAVGKV